MEILWQFLSHFFTFKQITKLKLKNTHIEFRPIYVLNKKKWAAMYTERVYAKINAMPTQWHSEMQIGIEIMGNCYYFVLSIKNPSKADIFSPLLILFLVIYFLLSLSLLISFSPNFCLHISLLSLFLFLSFSPHFLLCSFLSPSLLISFSSFS